MGFGRGEPHYFAHRLDPIGDNRFRQLFEFLDPADIPGDGEFAGGSLSTARPFTSTRPSRIRKIHSDPLFQSDSTVRPKKYCVVKSLEVSPAISLASFAI
jgi:hypothetical protein